MKLHAQVNSQIEVSFTPEREQRYLIGVQLIDVTREEFQKLLTCIDKKTGVVVLHLDDEEKK